MNKYLAPAVMAISLFVAPTQAANMASHFEAMNSPDAMVRTVSHAYLNGIVESSMYFNAALRRAGKPQAFCLPDDLSLNRDLLTKIIERTYQGIPDEHKDPNLNVGMIAVIGLTNAYPCGEKQ